MEENEILILHLYELERKYPNDSEFGDVVRLLLNKIKDQKSDLKTILSNLNSNI
jgi:hypothetical protein